MPSREFPLAVAAPPTMTAMTPSLRQLRAVVEHQEIRVVVSDLDGVLRVFDQTLWEELDQLAGTTAGTVFGAVLQNPYLEEVTRGRGTHARWRELARERLIEAGSTTDAARAAVDRWAATPATVDHRVLAELRRFRNQGTAVFVLTNGTDRVPAELRELGLDGFLGAEQRFLLNTADLGAAKPEPEAFRRAQERIREVLGTEVLPSQLVLLDDSEGHVHGAKSVGWHAILHRAG